jgi:hypothetical protein
LGEHNIGGSNDERFNLIIGNRMAYAKGIIENVTWEMEGKTLTIKGIGDMPTAPDDWWPWYQFMWRINEVVIDEGITSVNEDTLSACQRINKLTLPNTLKTIGNEAFKYYKNDSIQLPNTLQSLHPTAVSKFKNITIDHNNHVRRSRVKPGDDGGQAYPYPNNHVRRSRTSTCSARGDGGQAYPYPIPYPTMSAANVLFAEGQAYPYPIPYPFLKIVDGVVYNHDLTTLVAYTKMAQDLKPGNPQIPITVTHIADYAFHKANIQTVQLHDNLTSIGKHAFIEATITYINLPASLTNLNSDAFDECRSLEDINVHPDNMHFKSIDGTLYNKNVTQLVKRPQKK